MKIYETKYGPVPADRMSISQRRAMDEADSLDLRKRDHKDIADKIKGVEATAKRINPQPKAKSITGLD